MGNNGQNGIINASQRRTMLKCDKGHFWNSLHAHRQTNVQNSNNPVRCPDHRWWYQWRSFSGCAGREGLQGCADRSGRLCVGDQLEFVQSGMGRHQIPWKAMNTGWLTAFAKP